MVRAHIAQKKNYKFKFVAFQRRYNKSCCLYIYIYILQLLWSLFNVLTNIADKTYSIKLLFRCHCWRPKERKGSKTFRTKEDSRTPWKSKSTPMSFPLKWNRSRSWWEILHRFRNDLCAYYCVWVNTSHDHSFNCWASGFECKHEGFFFKLSRRKCYKGRTKKKLRVVS